MHICLSNYNISVYLHMCESLSYEKKESIRVKGETES